jgi:hypothetical protein
MNSIYMKIGPRFVRQIRVGLYLDYSCKKDLQKYRIVYI